MKLSLMVLLCLTSLLTAQDASAGPLDFSVLDAEGNEVALSDYDGQVLLIVNVASRCGLTRQYAALQQLQERFAERGFTVLAFPANNFLGQEPGSNEEIQQFCSSEYGVTFPVFAKLSVKGKDQAPLYKYLTEETNKGVRGRIRWNFDKFLVAQDGSVIERFGPSTSPDADEVVNAIEQALGEDE